MQWFPKRSWMLSIAVGVCICITIYLLFEAKFTIKDESPVVDRAYNNKGKKLLLIYSTWFRMPQWGIWTESLLRKEFAHCHGSNNCIATYNKGKLHEADALLFHGRDIEIYRNGMYSASVLRDLRQASGTYDQKWIFLSHETPQRDVSIYRPYDGIFNWTATYNRNSDVFAPYGQYVKLDAPHPTTINYAKTKKYLAAWPVSNCDVKLRLEYALELEKYIPLTVYGSCGRFFKSRGECPRRNKNCHDRLGLYKFYFAFENEFCHDWMTEKYWRAIKVDSVPVVMGENFEGLAIPGSYIDVNNFPSIKALAEYLLYLDKNDDEYNKYFSHKTSYKEAGISYFCAICDKLNSNEFTRKTKVDLSNRYSFQKTCLQDPNRIAELTKQVQESKKEPE